MKRNYSNPLKFKNYFSYLYANAKKTSFAQNLKNIYSFFRKYIFVGRLFRIIRIVFLWLQTGTYFLFLSTALLIFIPIVVLLLLGFYLYSIYMHKKCNKLFAKIAANNKLCVIFKETENEIDNDCSESSVRIYVIRNPLTQLTDCVKRYGDRDFCISMNYFYSLKKYILDKNRDKVTYVL